MSGAEMQGWWRWPSAAPTLVWQGSGGRRDALYMGWTGGTGGGFLSKKWEVRWERGEGGVLLARTTAGRLSLRIERPVEVERGR